MSLLSPIRRWVNGALAAVTSPAQRLWHRVPQLPPFLQFVGSAAAGLIAGLAIGGTAAKDIAPFATAAVGAVVAWAALGQAKIAGLRHEAQTNTDRQQRLTDSFSTAVEQLGNDKLEVRLGGIYTMEAISRESTEYYGAVMNTLSAFVRNRAHRIPDRAPTTMTANDQSQPMTSPTQISPAEDVMAVMTVIGTRAIKNIPTRIDFSGSDLRGARLGGLNFDSCIFNSVNLDGAYLDYASLREAIIYKSTLNNCSMEGCHLEGVKISQTNIMHSDLSKSHLDGSFLHFCLLEGTKLLFSEVSGCQGTEPFVAKPTSESPASAEQLMEEVCERENLVGAWNRVQRNQGSPGVDGMTHRRR